MNYSNKKITKNKPLFICITPLKLHMGYKLIFFLSREISFQEEKYLKYRCLANRLTLCWMSARYNCD